MDEPRDTSTQPTLLSQIPATDPAVLKRMEEARAESRHYSAIGRVAAEGALFETVIDNAAIDLAQVEYNAGICFTAQVAGSARKLDAFISLARLRGAPKKLVSDLCKFAQDVTGVAEQRNRIVHDVWLFRHPDVPNRLEATARKVLRVEDVPTSTEDVHKLANLIIEKCDQFIEMQNRLADALRAPDKGQQDTGP